MTIEIVAICNSDKDPKTKKEECDALLRGEKKTTAKKPAAKKTPTKKSTKKTTKKGAK